MRKQAVIIFLILLWNLALPFALASLNAWTVNASYYSGLPDIGNTSRPAICFNLTGDEKWDLISGNTVGNFYGYYWDGAQWVSSSTVIAGLGDIGATSLPSIAFNTTGDGKWTLIAGQCTSDAVGNFFGFYWDTVGATWISDSGRVAGLGNIGLNNRPYPRFVFNLTGDGKWDLIVGGSNDAYFKSWYWDTSLATWVNDNSLISGISGCGSYNSPSFKFNILGNQKWLMLVGTRVSNYGVFRAFDWSGSSWIRNSTFESGVSYGDGAICPDFASFLGNATTEIVITGHNSGYFRALEFSIPNPIGSTFNDTITALAALGGLIPLMVVVTFVKSIDGKPHPILDIISPVLGVIILIIFIILVLSLY